MNTTEKIANVVDETAVIGISGYGQSVCPTFENPREVADNVIKAYRGHLKSQGLTIVPIEPTDEMVEAAENVEIQWHNPVAMNYEGFYKAMIAAYTGDGE